MATKAPAPPQDDFNLDDIKLDDFPMEDNALFADLDNEMRADGGAGKSGGDDLDLNLDLDNGSGGAPPALEEPGELKFDDTLDLDLNLDDAPQASAAGADDLDLNLDEPAAAAGGQGGDADLDLNLDLDEDGKTGDADLQLDAGLDLNLDDGNQGGGDLKLDDDLDLKLDEPEAPAAEAGAGGDVELDLDMGSLDLNLDDSAAASSESLSLDEPSAPSFSMDEPTEPTFEMDLPEEPGLSLESETPAESEPEGLSLSVVEPEAPAMDISLPEPEAPEMPAAPAMAESAEPELDLTLDEGFRLDTIPEATAGGSESEAQPEFQAAPDINLDDIDLSLETSGAEAPALEPLGAQVDFEAADTSAPTMEENFDLPPLAETKGDVEGQSAEPFVAVPDVKLTEDEMLELNLPHDDMGDAQPEFTMAPEPMPGSMQMGGGAGEFRLTEPLSMEAPQGMGAGMRMNAPQAAAAAMARGMSPSAIGAGRAPREAAVSQDILLTIPHKISVQMGQVNLIGKDIRNLAYGSVVQLNRTVGEPVDLLLDGKSIAQGEIVLINGKNLGVRILALNK